MILFAGKELPAGNDMASGASFQGRKVVATAMASEKESEDEQASASSSIIQVNWNRTSSISARSMALKCENAGGLDEVVMVFDEFYFATKYRTNSNNAQVMEELIESYQYLSQELLTRFERNPQKKVKIAFLHKSNYSLNDGVVSGSIRSSGLELSNPLISAASAAFKAYAENFAAVISENPHIMPLLVSCEPTNELSRKDSSLAVWICEYMDSIDNLKKPLSPKQKVSWVKAGAKNPGGFGLF